MRERRGVFAIGSLTDFKFEHNRNKVIASNEEVRNARGERFEEVLKISAEPITFADALARTTSRRRLLLLGNGFSIGAHQSFGYPSLYEDATYRNPSLKSFFDPGDTNFEAALRKCGSSNQADQLRAGLIKAVAAVHPENALKLPYDMCRSCWNFLEHFVGRAREPRGILFTTNYDLLLHWVLSKQGKTPGTKQRTPLRCWDGFAADGVWNPAGAADVYYLHGAVHIFEDDVRAPVKTRMLRYGLNRPLLKQVDQLLANERFPVFVAEGTSSEKRAAQQRWEYLAVAARRFAKAMRKGDGVLFAVGHSFGESDEHISTLIGAGSVGEVYLGAYSLEDRERADDLAATWATVRNSGGRPPVTVYRFDVRECAIWDGIPSRIAAE